MEVPGKCSAQRAAAAIVLACQDHEMANLLHSSWVWKHALLPFLRGATDGSCAAGSHYYYLQRLMTSCMGVPSPARIISALITTKKVHFGGVWNDGRRNKTPSSRGWELHDIYFDAVSRGAWETRRRGGRAAAADCCMEPMVTDVKKGRSSPNNSHAPGGKNACRSNKISRMIERHWEINK